MCHSRPFVSDKKSVYALGHVDREREQELDLEVDRAGERESSGWRTEESSPGPSKGPYTGEF